MRTLFAMVLVSLSLAACGGGDTRPVIVTQPPGSTVVVPPSGAPIVCPNGARTC
jgi:hypothetical protein